MEHDKTIECPEKATHDDGVIASKATNTQSVIINKYKKARMNRLEREHESTRAIKPLFVDSSAVASHLSNDSASKQTNFSLPTQSKKSDVQASDKLVNALCARLRLLLTTPFANSENHTGEMNSILNELRALGIIV